MKPICVLAGRKTQYEDWMIENGLTKNEAIYCDSQDRLRGAEFSKIKIVGDFWSKADAGWLYELAQTRVR